MIKVDRVESFFAAQNLKGQTLGRTPSLCCDGFGVHGRSGSSCWRALRGALSSHWVMEEEANRKGLWPTWLVQGTVWCRLWGMAARWGMRAPLNHTQ